MRTSSNDWKTFDITVTDLRHEEDVEGIVINAHEITDRKVLENDLRHKVLHDDLTGIANRVLFRERLDHALATQARSNNVTAVLFIDLDDFKTVNDGLGHDVGDELLKVIAFRLESFLRSGDTAARLSGDEFAVLLEDLYTVDDVMNAARRLITILQQPMPFGSRDITVGASVGVALADTDSLSDVVMRNADVAMYHAKRAGKGRVKLFDNAMFESAFERLELKTDLAKALERNEISLQYQPLVSMADGSLLGFEALMRWTHATRGFVSPVAFIPLAEETGLILELGAWALNEATSQLARWRRDFPALRISMSVNVSPRQMEDDRIIDDVKSALELSGANPEWVILEITESSALEDPISRERVVRLRSLGFGIAADDFGTGFASYSSLQQLPFTDVKIDRSLIIGLSSNDGKAQAQVRSIIQMGHALGVSITAEGIEDARQRDSLKVMGADKGQGYLFWRPLPALQATDVVAEAASALSEA
jgi:diguanylate cyclase (GGDEF)-like protein